MGAEGFSWEGFKEILDDRHLFPEYYLFKFIVPKDKKKKVLDLFKGEEIRVRSSKNGRFVSITARCFMKSSEEVITIYKMAAKIEGIVAL